MFKFFILNQFIKNLLPVQQWIDFVKLYNVLCLVQLNQIHTFYSNIDSMTHKKFKTPFYQSLIQRQQSNFLPDHC